MTTATESIGWQLICAERQRQITDEGWKPEHDDQHVNGELAAAGRCYLLATDARATPPAGWPWEASWWKPRGRAENLLRAGALYLAESERLERAGKPAADRLRRASMAVAEGLSKFIDRGPIPAPREDHRP